MCLLAKSVGNRGGFRYILIDTEILEGSHITIYKFHEARIAFSLRCNRTRNKILGMVRLRKAEIHSQFKE